MANFFSISHNSFYKIGFPWIDTILNGLIKLPKCSICGEDSRYPDGEITVHLERNKGSKWPDILGCGAELLFIVSRRVLENWQKEGVGEFPIQKVHVKKPYSKNLEGTEPPEYFWIDGKKTRGAILDIEASGFVDGRLCEGCGRIIYNIEKSYDLQNSRIVPYVFNPDSWNGSHLFSTDISYTMFFCTDLVLECARKYQFLNFRFTPVEEGKATSSKGIKYLTKRLGVKPVI